MIKFDINESLGYIIAKTNLLMKTYFNKKIKESGLDITSEQWAVLYAINYNPGISQTEIAKISLKDKTNVTRILDLLEKKGYIVRNSVKNDRRVYSINLTNQGNKILEKLFVIAKESNDSYITGIQFSQITELFNILRTICDTIENNNK